MSTDLHESDEFSVTRFFGGVDRGVCVQITTPDGAHIQLQVGAVVELGRVLIRAFETGQLLLPAPSGVDLPDGGQRG